MSVLKFRALPTSPKAAERRARYDRMVNHFSALRVALAELGYPPPALRSQEAILAAATEVVQWVAAAQARAPPEPPEPVPEQSPEVTAFFARD